MSTYMQGALKSGDGFSEVAGKFGTQYAGGVDAKTAGRVRPTFTAAQLAAMDDIGANTSVYATITSVGQPTAGSARVTLLYTGGVA